MNIEERINHLRKLIKYHSKRYYENDAPEISEFEATFITKAEHREQGACA